MPSSPVEDPIRVIDAYLQVPNEVPDVALGDGRLGWPPTTSEGRGIQ